MVINLLLFLLISYCSYTDLKFRKIYNHITLPAVVIGIGLNSYLWGWKGLEYSMAGFLIGFLILIIFFWVGGLGGGDIKLLAAIGALKGYPFILYATFYAILVGGILAIVVLVKNGSLFCCLKNILYQIWFFFLPGHSRAPKHPVLNHQIPFGLAICLGTLWALILIK